MKIHCWTNCSLTRLTVELGYRNRAASNNARVMTPLGSRKSTLEYLYFTIGLLAPISMSKKPTNYIFLCSPKSVSMTPINMSQIIFNPLITVYLIPDKGALTVIGMRIIGCGKLFLNASKYHLPSFRIQVSQKKTIHRCR